MDRIKFQFAWPNRRACVKAFALAAAAVLIGCGGGNDDTPRLQANTPRLQATWTAAPLDYNAPSPFGPSTASYIENQTVRQVMRISAGGTGVRVRLSNLFGPATLTVDQVRIARSNGGPGVDATTDTALRFGGSDAVSIPAGQEIWSDVVPANLSSNSDVAVTLYIAGKMQIGTYHQSAVQQTYVANGNQASSATLTPIAPNSTSYYWLSGIDVQNATTGGTIVAIGDSITDGVGSTTGASRRYPNGLSARVLADPGLAGYSVVNAGMGGNRILHDVVGPMTTSRFQRDALLTTGASHVIILIGINDILFSNLVPSEAVTVDQITAGLQQLVDQARAKNVKVYLATLTPCDHALGADGNPSPAYDASSEAKRQQVNAWIRTNTAKADGVLDFDVAIRDPSAPTKMLTAYDSGDHLHPSDQGYQAMVNAINLSLFR